MEKFNKMPAIYCIFLLFWFIPQTLTFNGLVRVLREKIIFSSYVNLSTRVSFLNWVFIVVFLIIHC
jgi:hypothetical protein